MYLRAKRAQFQVACVLVGRPGSGDVRHRADAIAPTSDPHASPRVHSRPPNRVDGD